MSLNVQNDYDYGTVLQWKIERIIQRYPDNIDNVTISIVKAEGI